MRSKDLFLGIVIAALRRREWGPFSGDFDLHDGLLPTPLEKKGACAPLFRLV